MTKVKKVLIETWGCQMNVADSESLLAVLATHNYQTTQSAADADLVILNTCHIREKAKHKVLSRLGELRELKESRTGMKIAVAGCVAQAEGKKLLKESPAIDVMIGPGRIASLPDLIRDHQPQNGPLMALGFERHHETSRDQVLTEHIAKPTVSGKNEVSRYVNIAQGCDNFCTFCVVPFTRGREVSREPEDVLGECRALVAQGALEISLLGQNVNSYGLDLVRDLKLQPSSTGPFVDLLAKVAKIPGLERLRFTTSNPHDFSPALAELFAKEPKLGRYMHLPVQSGNDTVLERMKRKVDVATYLERVSWLRGVDPEFSISTDIIVGFPGETEAQFEDTVALVEQVKFSFAYCFAYSPRKNTAAIRFRDQLSEVEKSRRLQKLMAVQDRITMEWNQNEIGRSRDVMFLYESKKNPGSFYGRSEQFRLVRVNSNVDLVGKTLPVLITDAAKNTLVGQIIP